MVKVHDKPDEPVSSEIEPSNEDDDGSFVVLERSTIEDFSSSQFPNGAQSRVSHAHSSPGSISMMNQPHNSMSPSYISVSLPDLSPEEIQRKLQEVLQENTELKETLHQNNLAMKQQFNTLVMWQEEVFKVHQSHKQKFQETRELIMKLRAENNELKSYLEKYGNSSEAQLKAENAKLKGQIVELQQKLSSPMPRRDIPHGSPSKKEEELSDLVKQLNTQLETAERARRQMTIEVESLTARHIRAEKEAAELKITLNEQIQKCSEMEKKNTDLHQEILQHKQKNALSALARKPEDHSEIQVLKSELEKTYLLIHELKEQVRGEKKLKQNCITQMVHQEKYLQELQKKMPPQVTQQEESMTKENAESEKELIDLLLCCCGERLKELNVFITRQAERSLSVEHEDILRKLFEDYQSLLLEWQRFHERQINKDRHNTDYYNTQAKSLSEKLDNLVAQVLCKDEEIEENGKKIKELQEKVMKLELENEAIEILNAQVKVYQADFNAERQARENLAGKKEQLSEDLRHLQRRNQELLDELETYRQSHIESMQGRNSGGSSWGTIATPGRASSNSSVNSERTLRRTPEVEPSPPRVYDEEVPPPKEYTCPMCNMVFRQLSSLEYHVETCLDSH